MILKKSHSMTCKANREIKWRNKPLKAWRSLVICWCFSCYLANGCYLAKLHQLVVLFLILFSSMTADPKGETFLHPARESSNSNKTPPDNHTVTMAQKLKNCQPLEDGTKPDHTTADQTKQQTKQETEKRTFPDEPLFCHKPVQSMWQSRETTRI